LAVEEQFYILWPPAFLWLAARGRRGLITALVLAVGISCAWRSGGYLTGILQRSYVYNAFETRMGALAIGCLLTILSKRTHADEWAGLLVYRAWFPLVTLALLLISRTSIGSTWHYTAGFTVDAILLGVLIIQVLQLHATTGFRWLSHPAVVRVGVLSYSLYLWHAWAYDIAMRIAPTLAGRVLLGTPIAFGLAWASHRGVELPFLAIRPRALAWLDTRRRLQLVTQR
jgi:peptidoglycan/LPS O-acetylase OafA/YrhL